MNETLLTIIFVAAVTIIFTFVSLRQKKSSWKGVLTDKKIKADDDDNESYQLIFTTDEGKRVRVSVATKQGFDQFVVGDRFEKKSGEYFPVKIGAQ
ncbi:MAG: DUF7489 domain-containing protein [Patescibacteria group bacterium]|jgi:kynurenine formamidase